MRRHFPEGSLWHQWDLHFHTPSSYDYKGKNISNQKLVESLLAASIRVVAITDHHTMDIPRIQDMQKLGGDKLTVLPGIELRSDQGGQPIHYIGIFPEDCDLTHVWTTLQGRLGLTEVGLEKKGGQDRIYIPIEDGARITRELGGVVSIHAGAKSNSIESISNREQFQKRIKFDITKKWIDIMEIGQIKDVDAHLYKIFPATGLSLPLMICSDNHDASQYSRKARLWLKADPTFRGLLMVLREPGERVYIGDCPPEHTRLEQNPTKYIRSLTFERKASAPISQKWFSGSIAFNPGLVAIIGNKGSGKSALSDTIGLLGATKNTESFSFLSKKRFRHISSGFAQHFGATIEWRSGEKVNRCLADTILSEEIERLKYLPQDHVERICNELAGIDKGSFEQELKSVIFSHVPKASQLDQNILDDLVRFQTDEKQKRIDTLLKRLRDISRSRAVFEERLDPKKRIELEEKIKRRQLEIDAHKNAVPQKVTDPSEGKDSPLAPELLKAVSTAEKSKVEVEVQIANTSAKLQAEERKHAVALRLLEKIGNYRKDYDTFVATLSEDADELGIDTSSVVSLEIKTSEIEVLRNATAQTISDAKKLIGADDTTGLRAKLIEAERNLRDLHVKLDSPNRAYQTYLKQHEEWAAKLKELQASESTPDSLNGLKVALTSLDDLPKIVANLKNQQLALSLDIHDQKTEQAAVYRKLYGPVQEFIDTHPLAKDKLKLEFRAELVDQGFAPQLLALLALNRRGSFMGTDEGKAKAEGFAEITQWENKDSVESFLRTVDQALHENQREDKPSVVQLTDQLVKGRSAEDVFNQFYGLEYVQPRYVLRWEGKDLSVLSPGERGTLLLVFYLLVDKSDLPLIIDQPEGNLDNHTVAKVLVDCIREARKRRQVFIVTHNPNLAVVCDADQVVHAAMDKENGNSIIYTSGALENPAISQYVTDVLEGTRWAFDVRGSKYKVGDKDDAGTS